MDWEYQSTGPIDVSSPFAKLAQGPRTSSFESPSKYGRQNPNPFAVPQSGAPLSPSKQQQPLPPHSAFFNPKLQPQLQNQFSAPPFRNPAFTTPQRRVDELAFSEVSGAESSPAMTDASEMPEDTPEVDRSEDLGRMTITQSTANRTLFGASATGGASKARSRTPGRGELRRREPDRYLRGKIRKRTRQTGDRDVGSVRSRLPHDSDDSDSDWEQDGGGKARRGKKGPGLFAGMLSAIGNNPNVPIILSKWVQLTVNVVIVGGVLWFFWGAISMVRADIAQATERARSALLAEMQACTHEYTKNRCSPKSERLPALAAVCDEWEACMNQDPTSVMKVQVSARNLAEVINEFVGVMSLKAWVSLLCLLSGHFLAVANISISVYLGLHSIGSASGHRGQQRRLQPPARVVLRRDPADQAGAQPLPVPARDAATYAHVAAPPTRRRPGVHLGAHRTDSAPHPARAVRRRRRRGHGHGQLAGSGQVHHGARADAVREEESQQGREGQGPQSDQGWPEPEQGVLSALVRIACTISSLWLLGSEGLQNRKDTPRQ